tara:strand:+ start:232 stop:597 length:366 start_codon:yes stop_codon:yes gene_type:complete
MTRYKVTSTETLEYARKQIGELDLSNAWEVEVKPFAFNRSVEQNKRYWKLISELGDYLGYDEGEMHELCKYKFLSYKQDMLGDEMVVVPSSSKLTIKEFVEYLSKVERFASELGFQLKGDY